MLEAPKVHRVADIQNTQIIYQPDPNVLERNQDLNEEVEYLTLQNQKLNLGLGNLKGEYDILEGKYKELEDLYKNNPRTIYVPTVVEKIKEVKQRIGNPMDRIVSLYADNKKVMMN